MPNCGVFASISLKYKEGDTGDYEGVCIAELEGGGLCGATLLLTVSLPKEATAEVDSSSLHKSWNEAPEAVVSRLPQYVRALGRLLEGGTEVISSQQLGERTQIAPAQIRNDLNHFYRFGKAGQGYNVEHLLERLKLILGLTFSRFAISSGPGKTIGWRPRIPAMRLAGSQETH